MIIDLQNLELIPQLLKEIKELIRISELRGGKSKDLNKNK